MRNKTSPHRDLQGPSSRHLPKMQASLAMCPPSTSVPASARTGGHAVRGAAARRTDSARSMCVRKANDQNPVCFRRRRGILTAGPHDNTPQCGPPRQPPSGRWSSTSAAAHLGERHLGNPVARQRHPSSDSGDCGFNVRIWWPELSTHTSRTAPEACFAGPLHITEC